MKVDFVDSQWEEHGVQPVLQALESVPAQIAPSTYYAAKSRPASARSLRDVVSTGRDLAELDRRQLDELEAGLRLGMLFVLLVATASAAGQRWSRPDPAFFLTTLIGLLVTLGISATILPLVRIVTEHDGVRFE